MFENISKRTTVLLGATAVGLLLTAVSAIKDRRDNACCCDELDCDCELADPTAEA